jgi:hypothetical protein
LRREKDAKNGVRKIKVIEYRFNILISLREREREEK